MSTFVPSQLLANENPTFTFFLLALGGFTFGRFLFKTVRVLLQTFLIPGKSLKKYGAGKGAWAVVTGASEGIGKEFAIQLAQKGFNVLLSARNVTNLQSVISEIETKCTGDKKVQTKVVPMDFSRIDDQSAWTKFASELEHLDIGVLINNVGRSYNMPTDFTDTTDTELDSILKININATVRVTKLIVPGMVQRKRGLVISVGSFSGISVVSPMLAVYAGSKSFLASFSASLAEEVKGKGVDVECLNTYFVVSGLSKIRRPSLTVPTPRVYVKSVLSKIGLPCGALYTGRPYVVTPFWSHAIIDWFMNVVGWKAYYGRFTHNLHKSIRRRALKKAEREAKKQ